MIWCTFCSATTYYASLETKPNQRPLGVLAPALLRGRGGPARGYRSSGLSGPDSGHHRPFTRHTAFERRGLDRMPWLLPRPRWIRVHSSGRSPPRGVGVDFGNGTDQTNAAPDAVSPTYSEPGEYFVTLSVTDDLGCTSTVAASLQVLISPEPEFNTVFDSPVCVGSLPSSTAAQFRAEPGPPSSRRWSRRMFCSLTTSGCPSSAP